MKKNKLLLVALAAVMLLAVILAGCKTEEPAPEPPVMDAYWNYDGAQYFENGVSTRQPEASGNYIVTCGYHNKLVKLKVKGDQELINKIDSLRIFGVVLDASNVVVGVKTVEEMGGQIVYDGYSFAAGGNFDMEALSPEGETVSVKTPSKCYVLDMISETGKATRAVPGELVRGDKIVAVQDYAGNITNVFVYESGPIRSGKDQYCPHCKQEVHFKAWTSDEQPHISGGHYFLYEDMYRGDQFGAYKNTQLVIDLNGFTWTVENETKRIIATYIKDCPEGNGCYLGFMDSSEAKTGTILNNHRQEQNGNGATVWVTSYGTVEMFGGTIDASQCVSSGNGAAVEVRGGCTFIMHEGATILGGTTEAMELQKTDSEGKTTYYTSGGGNGGAVYNGGTFIMYGGKIVGGTALGHATDRGRGGAIFNSGKFIMYDGEIVGGYADEEEIDKNTGELKDFSIIYDNSKNGLQLLGGKLTPAPVKEETPAPETGTETVPETEAATPEA